MRVFALAGVILVAGVLAASRASVASSGSAKRVSCNRELDVGQRHYRLARLPRGALKVGAKLPGRGRFQCEPALACRASRGCVPSSGRVFSHDALRRVRGIRPFLAVTDARSGRVYVNRAIFTAVLPPKFLLRDLRRGGGPQPTRAGAPPQSSLLSRGSMKMPLEWGSYCWTTLLGGDQSVRQCATLVPPPLRFDLPLVIAQPGSTLHGLLGFAPNSVQIILLDRAGDAVYSQTLDPAQTITWTVPTTIPARSWLVIAAGRPGFPLDSATYLARLQVTS